MSVLRLGKTYSEGRLETACELALTKVRIPRYHHLKAILASNQDQIYLDKKNNQEKTKGDARGFVRGSDYYGGENS